MPQKHFLKRLFTIQFTRKLLIWSTAALIFFAASFLLLRFFPEKAFELSSPYFGTIKATAASATNYLADISMIKNRVEGQRDTIDAAFANAAGAQRAASNANEQVILAHDQLEIMKTNAEFLQLIVQAYADDRMAFNSLVGLRFSGDPKIAHNAIQVVNIIVDSLDRNYKLGKNSLAADWQGIGIDPNTNSLEQLKFIFTYSNPATKTCLLNYIATSDRFPKVDRFDFVIEEISFESSLSVENEACEIMNDESKLNVNVLGANNYLAWWEINRSKYTNTLSGHP